MNNFSEIFAKLSEISPIVWLIIIALLVGSTLGVVLLKSKNHKSSTSSTFHTKQLVYGSLCIALSFILSYIRLYKLPYGGSITLASMFPLILYTMIFGPVAGMIAGAAYGLLQLIQDAWVIHWAQLLLDYPLAYACLGLAGIVPKAIKNIKVRICLCIPLAILGRTVMHVLSGVIFFASSAPDGMNPLYYSIIYNGSYLVPELIITMVLAFVLTSTPIYRTMKRAAINQ